MGKSPIRFHQGEALIRTAGTYGVLFEVVMEGVQNGLDANAKTITVIINKKKRTITVQDDGDGVTPRQFEDGLCSVCSSTKSVDKLGRFGIGLISPLGKCALFTFTSRRKRSRDPYICWTFETEAVRKQADNLTIPHRELKDVHFGDPKMSKPKAVLVDWTTQVFIENYSKDRHISNITSAESVANGIIERFGEAMRKLGSKVSVLIIGENGEEDCKEARPKLYSGKRLPEVTIEGESGKSVFRLYLAKKTEKGFKGKVVVGETDNAFRFSFKEFARSASSFIPSEVVSDLTSGVFEGEILTSAAMLHEDRKRFVENDALVNFCVAIIEWHTEHGMKHLTELKETRTEERYQTLGLRSLEHLEDLFKSSSLAGLFQEVLSSFKRGTIGSGHFDPDDKRVVGKQESKALAVQGGTKGQSGAGGTRSEGSERSKPERDKPAHHPLTVAGPQGQRRTVVKKDSVGLQFVHTPMEGSDRLWELDSQNGILYFNIRHPTWVACEGTDRQFMQLQEMITVQALIMHTLPDEWKQIAEVAYGEFINSAACLIQSSGSFNITARLKKRK